MNGGRLSEFTCCIFTTSRSSVTFRKGRQLCFCCSSITHLKKSDLKIPPNLMSCGTQSDTRPPGRAPCLSLSLSPSRSLRDCHKRFPFLKFGERSSSIFCCLRTVTPFQREKVYNYHFLHIAATFRTAVMDLISCKYIVSRPLF